MNEPPLRVAAPIEVVHVLWRLSVGGGVQTVMRSLIAALDPQRVRLTVVTARPRLEEDGLEALPVDVVGLGHRSDRLRVLDRIRISGAVAREVRRRRPAVVHLHSGTVWMGVAARMIAPRARMVLEVHDAPGSGRHGRLTDRVEGWFARFGRVTVVCHSSSVEDEVRHRWKMRRERVVRFPLSVDPAGFAVTPERRRAARAALEIGPEVPVVLMVGRMVASKRLDLAVGAFGRLTSDPAPALVLVGDGPARDGVLAMAARLGPGHRVLALGRCSAEELRDAYAAADVMVSTSDYEGFGLSLVEGMAAGLPVVATSVGGVTDVVVDGETGRLVAAGDETAVAAAVQALLDDPEERARMGAAGRARAEARFTPARLAEAFTDVYERRPVVSRLFVYGTLLPGEPRWYHLERFVVGAGRADTVSGTLYDTGRGYPALRLGGAGTVHGMTFDLAEATADEALAALDALEGAVEGLYRRARVVTGAGLGAFVYEYGRGLDLAPIPGGNWLGRFDR